MEKMFAAMAVSHMELDTEEIVAIEATAVAVVDYNSYAFLQNALAAMVALLVIPIHNHPAPMHFHEKTDLKRMDWVESNHPQPCPHKQGAFVI
jgi:hypothetical protein